MGPNQIIVFFLFIFAPLGSVIVGEVQTLDTSEFGLDCRLSRKHKPTMSERQEIQKYFDLNIVKLVQYHFAIHISSIRERRGLELENLFR